MGLGLLRVTRTLIVTGTALSVGRGLLHWRRVAHIHHGDVVAQRWTSTEARGGNAPEKRSRWAGPGPQETPVRAGNEEAIGLLRTGTCAVSGPGETPV